MNSCSGCLRPQLKEPLLYALSGNVAGNGRVVALTRDLVDLVDEDNTHLRLCLVVVCILKQSHEKALDIFSHISCLGQHRRIHDGEGHHQHLGNGAGQ